MAKRRVAKLPSRTNSKGPKKGRSPVNRPELLEALKEYIRTNCGTLLDHPNVTSVGVGYKIERGKRTNEIALQFTVRKKGGLNQLESLGLGPALPKSITVAGVTVPTDVVEREFHPSYEVVELEAKSGRKQRVDPMVPGISVSHPSGTAGTLGAIVYDRADGSPCILSNWHVLHTPAGTLGDRCVQPGPYDDNRVDLNRAGTLVRSHLGVAGDCAIARIEQREFDGTIYEFGLVPKALGKPELDDRVMKSGRTTGVTYGVVRRTDVVTKIDYDPPIGVQQIGGFEIGPDPAHPAADKQISMGGDSGSVWLAVDKAGKPTGVILGLHFAGEGPSDPDDHALACYAHSVFEKLEIALDPPKAVGPQIEAGPKRGGYAAGFLSGAIPAPTLVGGGAGDAVKLNGSPLLPYTHFSVCLSKARRMAHFVAWNIDGSQLKSLSRTSLKFKIDPRIDEQYQVGDELYTDNRLDRGHIARRADLVWGPRPEAAQANEDSFFFTNITPQHEAFNQSQRHGLWGLLENAIFEDVDVENLHVSVFGGPIFKDKDLEYRAVKIPSDFWKIIAYVEAGVVKAKAYILTQDDLLNDIEALELDPFRMYQVNLGEIEQRTKVRLGKALRDVDAFIPAPEALAVGIRRPVREILSRADLAAVNVL